MRTFSSSFASEITGSVIQPALCVRMYLDLGQLNLWTGTGELLYNGETYLGTGNLGTVSSVESNGNLAADSINLTLQGVDNSSLAIVNSQDYRGRKVEGDVILFGPDGNFIGGSGLFVGKIDICTITREAKSSIITMTVESHLIELNRARIRRYTNQDQALRDKTDIGFEYISKVAQDFSFTWGSKTMTLRGGYINTTRDASSVNIGSYIPHGVF